jgi:hypothetical protein
MPIQYPFIQTAEARAADRMAEADRDRLSAETGRQHVTDDQTVWPSPEALHLATAVIRRGYMLPETMEHPIVKFECISLASLLVALGLAPHDAACRAARDGTDAPRPDGPVTP